ncbi:uncharacterized protein LOC117106237 isoform X2 [Anneissia japonica]|uniref:uncharacterized protein LOC117106237 isoform X1 n=1 Tax=Anneissia japonica TaxID=1529436 RepID=UPI0014258EA9|nr:uncharacterized protein LOC117106237 isoform X1 [Anneissia japonica]XP_033103475.1 uncharacterized protein LOC117106237 isoform X2 [Anneissia japonica]
MKRKSLNTEDLRNALNQQVDPHLLGLGDDNELSDLIEEYFCRPGEDNDDDSDTESDVDDYDEAGYESDGELSLLMEEDIKNLGGADGLEVGGLIVEADVVENKLDQVFAGQENQDPIVAEDLVIKNCRCTYGPDKTPCINQYPVDDVVTFRLNMRELPSIEKDMFVMGSINALLNDGTKLEGKWPCRYDVDRKSSHTFYYFRGSPICRETFKFLHRISQNKLTALIKHLKENGAVSRRKRSGGRKNNSLVDYFLCNYGLGEKYLILNADNCSGQNKNSYMLWYLMWRTLTGQHKSVQLRFLIAGHTKFSPDWGFGLIKQAYRRREVFSVDDMVDVVRDSTKSGVNIPQLVMDKDGNMTVPIYNWQNFFQTTFKKLKGILSYHHFRFDSNSPGSVFVKEYMTSEEKEFNLLRKDVAVPSRLHLPELEPAGLSGERQWYLYQKIREFCLNEEAKNRTCPLPTEPCPH